MIRALSLIPIGVLVGIPVAMLPAPSLAAIGGTAGLLCAVGALGRLRPLVTVGASVALIQYTVALWVTGRPSSPAGAILLGVALAFALDVSEFLHRFRRAAVTSAALSRQIRHWILGISLGAATAAALAFASTLIRLGAPPAFYPLLAAAGALGTAAGILGAVSRPRGKS